jgi:hypothetical protein
MENNILVIVSLVISICSIVIGVINHRKIKSKCFGVDLGETSIDITTTSPSPNLKTENNNNIKN